MAKPTTEVRKISPKMAEDWLASNTHNRPLKDRVIDKLKGAIERGEWYLNGDAIRFDTHGTLQDGQHRLWAIALAERTDAYDGKGVETLVVRGLDPDAQMTMDMGTKRRLADHLKLMGYNSALTLGSVINLKWRLDNGLIRGTQVPTVQQALHVLQENPELDEATKFIGRWRNRFHGGAQVGLLWYEFTQRDADAAEAFFSGVLDGVLLQKDSPVYALRRQLEGSKLGSLMLMALTIKAWNAYMEGKEVDRLVWRPVGKHAEPFPRIEG